MFGLLAAFDLSFFSTAGETAKLLMLVGLLGILGLLFLIYFSARLSADTRSHTEVQLQALKELIAFSVSRIGQFESQIGTSTQALSSAGAEGLAVAREIIQAMEYRAIEVGNLLSTNDPDDLLRAHEMIGSNLDNASNAMHGVVKSDLILELRPEQFEFAIDKLLEAIETDLKSPPGKRRRFNFDPHRRRMTIRGFFKALQGSP